MNYTVKKIAIIESDWLFENIKKMHDRKASIRYNEQQECFELSIEELLDNKTRKDLKILKSEAVALIRQCDSMMIFKENK